MVPSAKNITIADVARLAGVSAGTVSAVLNNRPTVRATTRERVLSAIEQLGYRPSSAARSMGSRQRGVQAGAGSIGLIVKEANNPFYAEVAEGVRAVLADHQYLLHQIASEWSYEQEGRVIASLQEQMVRGLLIAPVLNEDANLAHLFALQRLRYPFVLLDEVRGLGADTVYVDTALASRLAAEHLIDLGHHRIVHMAGPVYTQFHAQDRIRGVQQAFSQSHLAFSDAAVIPTGASMADGYRAGLELFSAYDRATGPTGVTCFNDRVAIGLLRALLECGLRVPEDVSVVGYDDIEMAPYAPVPLTTVYLPKADLGRRAAEMLLEHIGGTFETPRKIRLDPHLVVRASTSPPASSP